MSCETPPPCLPYPPCLFCLPFSQIKATCHRIFQIGEVHLIFFPTPHSPKPRNLYLMSMKTAIYRLFPLVFYGFSCAI